MSPLSIKFTNVPHIQNTNTKFVGEFHDYLLQKGSLITSKRGLQTENINSCTAGVLNAGNKHFMFHAAPEMQSLRTIKQELEKQIEILKRTCEDVRGFICGGWELDTKNRESIKSFNLYTSIADTLDDLGVKFTMVCGKEKDAPLDNLHSINKSVTMWNEGFGNMYVGKSENLNPQEVADILEKYYQFVETNADDSVNIVLDSDAKLKSLVG